MIYSTKQINSKQFEDALIITCTGESGFIDWQEVESLKKRFLFVSMIEEFKTQLTEIKSLLNQ